MHHNFVCVSHNNEKSTEVIKKNILSQNTKLVCMHIYPPPPSYVYSYIYFKIRTVIFYIVKFVVSNLTIPTRSSGKIRNDSIEFLIKFDESLRIQQYAYFLFMFFILYIYTLYISI